MFALIADFSFGQCVIYFDDEDEFLASVQSPSMESFEGIAVTNSFTSDQLVTIGFTIDVTTPSPSLGVWDTPDTGGFATDGDNWVGYQSDDNETMTFSFNSPKNAFGLNIVDWGDNGSGTLTFTNDAGDFFQISVSPLLNGNQQFFGVINHDFIFTTVTFTQTIPGEFFGIDEVYCDSLAGPIMACKDINVSLNQDCEINVIPQMVLAGSHACADS